MLNFKTLKNLKQKAQKAKEAFFAQSCPVEAYMSENNLPPEIKEGVGKIDNVRVSDNAEAIKNFYYHMTYTLAINDSKGIILTVEDVQEAAQRLFRSVKDQTGLYPFIQLDRPNDINLIYLGESPAATNYPIPKNLESMEIHKDFEGVIKAFTLAHELKHVNQSRKTAPGFSQTEKVLELEIDADLHAVRTLENVYPNFPLIEVTMAWRAASKLDHHTEAAIYAHKHKGASPSVKKIMTAMNLIVTQKVPGISAVYTPRQRGEWSGIKFVFNSEKRSDDESLALAYHLAEISADSDKFVEEYTR